MDRDTRINSCDDHLDLPAVPPSLWESRLPRAQAERGLRVVERDGKRVWVCEDQVLFQSGNAGHPELKKLSAIRRAGIEDDGYRAGNPELRLQDMDRDNLWASVIYGPLAIGLPVRDPELHPNSLKAIEEALGTLSEADQRKVTATNCARLYGFTDAS